MVLDEDFAKFAVGELAGRDRERQAKGIKISRD
jgi:hypothetical protein